MTRTLRLAMALALIAGSASASSRSGNEHWIALSHTATGITGDIDLSPRQLRTSNARLPLRVAADVPAFKADFGTYPARILAVTRPANPVLLNKNHFCTGPVRWIVVYHTDPKTLGMAVYQGAAQPANEDEKGLCGTFSYSR